MPTKLWVPGWLTQAWLLAFAGIAIWMGRADQATTFIVGSAGIGVVRQIERDRRARGPDEPRSAPGGKV